MLPIPWHVFRWDIRCHSSMRALWGQCEHACVMHDSRIKHIRTVARFIGYNHTNMSRVAWSDFEALSACPLRLPKRLSGERLSEPRNVHDLHEHHAY